MNIYNNKIIFTGIIALFFDKINKKCAILSTTIHKNRKKLLIKQSQFIDTKIIRNDIALKRFVRIRVKALDHTNIGDIILNYQCKSKKFKNMKHHTTEKLKSLMECNKKIHYKNISSNELTIT